MLLISLLLISWIQARSCFELRFSPELLQFYHWPQLQPSQIGPGNLCLIEVRMNFIFPGTPVRMAHCRQERRIHAHRVANRLGTHRPGWVGSAIAGLLGSLTGLGGGVVLVPLLTLFFKVDIRYAIGASLVSVIATSSGAAAAYVKEGISNIR